MRAKIISLALTSIVLVGCSDSSTDVTANQVPNALAGDDQSVNEGAEVTLDGSASNSPNGHTLSYSWEQTDGTSISLTGANSASASFIPEVSADTKLTFKLTVTDSVGSIASDEVVISVNNAPTATVSAEQQSGYEGGTISVSGGQSSDSDNGSIASYQWSQLDGTQATFASTEAASTTISLPMISADEELVFQLLVTDNQSASSKTSFTITVLNDSSNPDIDTITIAEGDYGIDDNVIITITAADSETDLQLQDGSSFNGQELSNFAAMADQAGAYTATYTVVMGDTDWSANSTANNASITLVDIAGNLSETITQVELGDTNIDANLPTAKAGINQAVNERAEVELSGSNSFDAYDGSIASYSWEQIDYISAHKVNLVGAGVSAGAVGFTAPDLSADATLTFQLTVFDRVGNSDTDAVEVKVNNSPTANASGDQQVNESETVTLDGSGSNDTGDIIESYNWVQVADSSGAALDPATVTLTIDSSDPATATFIAPPVDQDTTLYFKLTVTDDDGASHSDTTTVFVNNNPTVTLGTITPAVEVNEGVIVTLNGSAEDTDDGSIASYTWIEVDSNSDPVGSATIELNHDDTTQATATFTAPSVDQDTTLYFQLTATDNVGGTSSASSIAAVPVNSSPTIELDETKEVNESTEGVSIIAAATDVGGSISSYSWIEVDSSGSEVNPSSVSNLSGTDTATISFNTNSVDQDTTLTFQLTVTDNDGANHTDSIVVTINNAPTAEAGSSQEVNESSDNAPIQVTLSGSASSDTNDGEITYFWEFDSSSDSAITSIDLTNANTATPTFTAPEIVVDDDNKGVVTLTFQLTVTDNDGATDQSQVEVAVHNLPIIESVYLADGAYGIGDAATVYIRAGNQETGLTLKEGSSFNELKEGEQVADGESDGLELTSFSEIGDGLYSATYKVLESHASVANGANAETNITLVDVHDHESTTLAAVPLDGEYIDTVRPAIDEIIIADGAYGAGAEMTLYIQVADNEAGLVVKKDSNFSFNDIDLTTEDGDYIFTEIGSGIYQSIYTILEGHTERADGTEVPIAITLTDPAGNDSTTYTPTDSFVPTITLQGESIDTSSPEISITSVGGDDNITNSSEVDAAEIIGTTTDVEDGQTVTITVKDSADPSVSAEITTTVTNNSFSADINLSTLADGDITVTADVSDAAGNAADAATGTVKKDTEAPAQTIGSIALSADTGTLGDFITNTASQTITAGLNASLVDGDTLYGSVNSYDSGDVNWTDITNSISTENGNSISWTTTLTSGSIQFKVVDAAGNDGVVASQAYTLDTTIPSIDTLVVADGGDGVINSVEDDAVEISGTTSGAENGQTVNLTITNNNDASITTTTTATVSSDGFSTADSGNNLDLSDLADGTYTVTASVSDIAGNEATDTVDDIAKDTAAPTVGISSVGGNDNIINSSEANALVIIGTTSGAEDDQTVNLTITNNNDATITTTATVSENGFSTADSSNNLDLSALADGTYTVTASVSDIAGNEATDTVDDIAKDTAAPTVGISSVGGNDNIINSSEANALVIIGTTSGAEDDQTVNLTITNNNDATITTTATATVSGNGFSTADSSNNLDLSALADGTYTVTASVSDIAGNEATDTVDDIAKDTAAPTVGISSVGGNDNIINSSEANALVIIGTTSGAEDDQTVNLTITNNNDATITTTATVSENGFSTADSSNNLDLSALADGTYTVTASVSDIAGNEATDTVDDIAKDTAAPTVGISSVGGNDNIINSSEANALVIIGTTSGAEDDQTVNLTITNNNDATITTTATATVSGNGFSTADNNLDLSVFADGTYTITANISDAAGNAASPASTNFTIDTTAPTINTSGTDTTVDEAGTAILDASNSTDTGGTGVASYSWVQVESNSDDAINTSGTANNYAPLNVANNKFTNFSAPGIADDSEILNLYFKLTVTDTAGNSASSISTVIVNNLYTTPAITANAGVVPDFGQITLSWPTTTGLTYSLYRSTEYPGCYPVSYQGCENGVIYIESGTEPYITKDEEYSTASITDIGLEFITTYYYWLEAKLNGELVLLNSVPAEAATSGPGLNDTGVVACDATNDATLVNEDCEIGRDADEQLNADTDGHAGFSFTKLNIDGSDYGGNNTYSEQPWYCVRDNVTGLVWEIKTDNSSLRDKDEVFTWHDGDSTGTASAQDTGDFITYANTTENAGKGLCGLTNWRLPTVQEIESLASYNSVPAIDTNYFPNTRDVDGEWYWTAEVDTANSNSNVWAYNAYAGSTASAASSNSYYVRLVSSSDAVGAWFSDYSDSRYTDHEDGTISDQRTGLMWMKCTYGLSGTNCNTGSATSGDWQAAFVASDTSNAANDNTGTFTYTDWRLPNKKELSSIVDLGNHSPAINDMAIFPNTQSATYWTSTPSAADDTKAFTIDFATGIYGAVTRDTTTTVYVRLVRDITTTE